jgi:L-cysteine:1D-myo-inositol 2-amino-2-deoxy-alpha-D-glucopyranoside ligase
MKLYDTAAKAYVVFKPSKTVGIYTCGITPYDSAHLGHIFTFMTYDLLQRRLEDLGHEVRMVRNITDVDEPIYKRAKQIGIPYTDLAKKEIKSFQETMKLMNFRPTYAEPLASEYIDEMASAVKELIDNGFTYRVDEDIYFDTSKFRDFSKFSGFNNKLLLGLFKLRGGDPKRPGKREPLDFLLWKSISDANDPAQWDSVVGIGRPGWHIECSVMASKLLETPFDIHGGGADLIFPHHSCEIAQSYGLGVPLLARHWTHVSPLISDGEKMSKSLGNLVFARDLLKDHSSSVIRLALMHYHYRIGGEWQPELLNEAKNLLESVLYTAKLTDKTAAEQFLTNIRCALDDDINTLELIDAFHTFIDCKKSDKSSSDSRMLMKKAFDLAGIDT